jgi:hypothetical protein
VRSNSAGIPGWSRPSALSYRGEAAGTWIAELTAMPVPRQRSASPRGSRSG